MWINVNLIYIIVTILYNYAHHIFEVYLFEVSNKLYSIVTTMNIMCILFTLNVFKILFLMSLAHPHRARTSSLHRHHGRRDWRRAARKTHRGGQVLVRLRETDSGHLQPGSAQESHQRGWYNVGLGLGRSFN